jgi:hypothetical protein
VTYTSELNEALLAALTAQNRVSVKDGGGDGFFNSVSGQPCWLSKPERSYISIHDIAVALARIPRWGGRTRDGMGAYSVTEHSVMVSQLCHPENALVGLLHDAPEAYLGDIPSPLKRQLGEAYYGLERIWALELGRRYKADLYNLPVDVKCADLIALEVERHDLMCPTELKYGSPIRPTNLPPIRPQGELVAYSMFVLRYQELTGRKS